MTATPEGGLTISAVAARTGVSVPVLRAWERRFGFPQPHRLGSGHRRYPETEVARIQQVVAARSAGRSLEAAIELVRAAGVNQQEDRSIFGALRRARPDLAVAVIGRRTMLALSRAIEDECSAQGEQAHLVAAFQREEVYRRASPRWDALAAAADSTIVFADFATSSAAPSGVLEIALADASPLRREWSVVCDAPASAAVLAGWERPEGAFEAMWTVDPLAVRFATSVARGIAAAHAPELELPPAPSTPADVGDPGVALRRAMAVTNRVVAYLDR